MRERIRLQLVSSCWQLLLRKPFSSQIPTKKTTSGTFVLSQQGKPTNRVLDVLPSGFEQADIRELTVYLRDELNRWSNMYARRSSDYFPGSIIGGPGQILSMGVPGVKQAVPRGYFGSLYVQVPSKAIMEDYYAGKFMAARRGRCLSGSVYDLRIRTKDGTREWKQRAVARHFDLHHIQLRPDSILFVRCIPNHLYKMRLPVVLLNEDKCEGLRNGHLIRYHRAVDVIAENIEYPPAAVFADLEGKVADSKIFVRDLLVPSGVQIVESQDKEMFYVKPEREDKEAMDEAS
ncbi:hypothetical protein GpartN1_g1742.t1 [Galdieria partita]|uniref:Ribosomal protein L25 beta domain-containing protein n=1 Tax=Galdieria partita TaxID=83374 RepID=A0A9C7PT62_9RHOD|nr:hypothetical protein GpartN1_g1742.t1 [Galdieria partita]